MVKQLHHERWLASRSLLQKDPETLKNMSFAKQLFECWDTSGDGSISEDEALKPLVSLGLMPDYKAARKVW